MRSYLNRRTVALAGLFVSLLVALGAWGISSPTGSSPDDTFHLGSIWCARDLPGRECSTVRENQEPGIDATLLPARIVRGSCYAMQPERSASCQRWYHDNLIAGRTNAGLYPAGFYSVMHLFVGSDFVRSVLLIRAVNTTTAAVMVLLALLLSPVGLRRAFALSLVATLVPLAVFFIPSTNPTSWAIVGLSTYWVFLIRFLTGPPGRATWLAGGLAGLAAAMAMSARTDARAYLCVVTAGVVLLGITRLRDLFTRRHLLPLAVGLVAAVGFLTAQAANALTVGSSPLDASEPGRSGLSLLVNNVFNLPMYLMGMFGGSFGLGWIDTPLPWAVGPLMCALTFAVAVLSMGSYWRYKAVGVLMLAAASVVAPLVVLQQSHAFVGEVVQPRYVYPLFVVLVGFVAYTPPHRDGTRGLRLERGQVALFAVAATIANSYALHTEIKRYITGLDVRQLDLGGAEWWWQSGPGPVAVWLIGTVAAAAVFALLGMLALDDAPRETSSEVPGEPHEVAQTA